MKKMICYTLVIAIGLIFSSTSAFAVVYGRTASTLATNTAALSKDLGTTNIVNVSMSKGVALAYSGEATKYSAGTLHMNGDREYGTTSTMRTIFWDYGANGANQANGTGAEPTAGQGATWAKPTDWSSL